MYRTSNDAGDMTRSVHTIVPWSNEHIDIKDVVRYRSNLLMVPLTESPMTAHDALACCSHPWNIGPNGSYR